MTQDSRPPQLEIRTLSKSYSDGISALDDVSFSVEPGESVTLLGPSGSGKSTLLRIIMGLDQPDRGDVLIDGKSILAAKPHERPVALLPQKPVLYPHLTVRQNLESVKPFRGNPVELPDLFLLENLKNRYPHELSGGEKQRVALAKLFLRNTGVRLLDEPFSSLDPEFRSEIRFNLHLLVGLRPATMILVTHDPADAFASGQRIGVLHHGRLLQLGTAGELLANPLHTSVASSLGQYSLISGDLVNPNDPNHGLGNGDPSQRSHAGKPAFVSECGSIRIPISAELLQRFLQNFPAESVGSKPRLTFGIRPYDVAQWSAGSSPDSGWVELRGWTCVSAEPVGSGWLLTVARGRTRLRTEWRSGSPPPVGSSTDWILNSQRCIWFDHRTRYRLSGNSD